MSYITPWEKNHFLLFNTTSCTFRLMFSYVKNKNAPVKYLYKDVGLVSGNELRQLEDLLSVFVGEIPEEKEKRIETDGNGCYYAIEKRERYRERERELTADEKLRRSHAALQQENGRQSHRAGSGCSGLL